MSDLTVEAVSTEPPRQWGGPPNGPFLEYKVKFKEHPGQIVNWSRKPDSAPPTAGQTVTGTIDWSSENAQKFGPKFTLAKKEGYGGGGSKGDFRSKEQIILQESDRTAAILMLANAHGGLPWNMDDFHRTSAELQARVTLAAKPYGVEDTAVRKDIEFTGTSDVPSDGFDPPAQMSTEPDDIPF